ncbi:MAG: DMT family transporter [Rhodoferax sp.]|nr:DMT family transporter [Rhodoferax sp.]
MQTLSRQQWAGLVLLTLIWGVNWPVMKLGVTHYPPLSFRALSMWLGLPVLALGLRLQGRALRVARSDWPELLKLAAANMFVWHALIIVAVRSLSSGRAAILGYSMPIFSALLGAWIFGNRLVPRAWAGVAAAALGVLLLLWHEFTHLAGSPAGVAMALMAALAWAYGTHLLRRTRLQVPTLTICFWMTVMTALLMSLLALLFERDQWTLPPTPTGLAILYNAVLIFGLAHAIWYSLARDLPPVASTLSVMLIPVLGVFSGALALGEVLHWQDWAAVLLMVLAIASVLWPARRS